MAVERTFSIIKPDAVEAGNVGNIIAKFEAAGLTPVAIRRTRLSRHEAQAFYAVHRERPFFGELVAFMTRSPCVLMVLEGEDAVARNREIMGATNPAAAAEGTLRKLYGSNVGENAVHGSDSPDNAVIEATFFFRGSEIHS